MQVSAYNVYLDKCFPSRKQSAYRQIIDIFSINLDVDNNPPLENLYRDEQASYR